MGLSSADFAEFFVVKKNGTYKCPFCGQEAFTINWGNVDAAALVMDVEGIPAAAHKFFSFSCTNCGHSDFFHERQVNAWLESKKALQEKVDSDGQPGGDDAPK